MRIAALFCALLAVQGSAVLADDLPPDDAVWGCTSAAFFDRVDGGIADHAGPAYRALYTSYFAEGSDSVLEDRAVRLPDGHAFLQTVPECWDINGDGVPDPIVVRYRPGSGLSLTTYVRGAEHRTLAAHPAASSLAPVAIGPLGTDADFHAAYLSLDSDGSALNVVGLRLTEITHMYQMDGFADPTGIDPRVRSFARDCGDGPELVLPSSDWATLDAVRVGPGGLERVKLADKPDFSRLVRALECHTE